jgi:hypothetical protein
MYLVGATRRPIAILPPIFIPAGLRSFSSETFTYFYFDGQQQTNQLNLTEIGAGIFMEIQNIWELAGPLIDDPLPESKRPTGGYKGAHNGMFIFIRNY